MKKNFFAGGGQKGLFKVKNRPVIKDQEVRGQVSTSFSEVPNSGLTDSEKIFVALFQF